MARDEDDDLYDEEFDFVDDDDDLDDEEEPAADDSELEDEPADDGAADREPAEDEEPVDEYGRTEPAANYVVHVYEHKKFKRTIDRPFTPEDAESFASEFNRTGKSYGRFAVTAKNDAKPKKTID
ncbi:MAG: hypothetical protein U0805_17995 [Pirellulales bacterium]